MPVLLFIFCHCRRRFLRRVDGVEAFGFSGFHQLRRRGGEGDLRTPELRDEFEQANYFQLE